jgi:DNA-directed RNA polymerase subunit RPC12/RpoP
LDYLEKVGRYEELATEYENMDLSEKAGEIRRRARLVAEVRVDLNDLIRQLGERGFTITYHCSNCGASLEIGAETEVEAVKSCSHCGSRIEAIDLARLIKNFLS